MNVTWHDNGRGPRVLLRLGGEDFSLTAERAREIHYALGKVLDEIDTAALRKASKEG